VILYPLRFFLVNGGRRGRDRMVVVFTCTIRVFELK